MPIRLLTPQDAAAYRSLRLAALTERPPAFGAMPADEPGVEEMAIRLQETADRCFFGAFEAGNMVGILRLSRYSGSNEKHRAYIAGVYVSPGARRHGWGRALVQTAIDRAKAIPDLRRLNLTVVSEQLTAIRLYESLGFVHCGTDIEAFSCDGRFYDELLMTLHLAAIR